MPDDPWSFGWDEVFAILNLIALVGAAVIARAELHSWWRERLITRKIEVAEGLLGSLYDIRDFFNHIRNPLVMSTEGHSRPRADSEPPENTRLLDSYYAHIERISDGNEHFTRFFGLRGSTLAVLGRDYDRFFVGVLGVRQQIFLAYRILAGRVESGRNKSDFNGTEKFEFVLWKGAETPDKIDAALDKLVSDAEGSLFPLFKREAPSRRSWRRFWRRNQPPDNPATT